MHVELEQQKKPSIHHSEPQRVGFAVVGLSASSLATRLPVFESCENARLSALVTGHPMLSTDISRAYDIPLRSVYSFHDFDRIKDDRDVQVVYIALRGSLRDEMILRAARAGKHVICEGEFSSDARIDRDVERVCDEAGVKFMITYRRASSIELDHMANCVLLLRAPLKLSEILRGAKAISVDVARWAN